ncbi:MAG: MBL fold metallo-hydrolase [Desulfosarcina sp.]|nr:MBL fold metallo-hydrolase [Desulfosarcina sp.]MBC2743057.1 MBL fold metallo-hydrolase [Desulfosarcina sp.]MBC2765967.1 MBL fold metallo-hydrolase [Desulfosarcina sp.]
MGPSFLPRLVNGPFDDPALFVLFRHENRALLFDLGDIAALAARDILKVTHIFVTHTHMDHFAGFDRVLRLLLGRDKDLFLYGPQGFLANLSGKLSGYCWNLVENYQNRFTLHATELHPDRALCCRYPCRNGFLADDKVRVIPFAGVVLSEPALTVRAVHLDHGTPVLAFALDERFHINIIKEALDRLRLPPGPWLNRFKAMLYGDADPGTTLEIPTPEDGEAALTLSLGELKKAIARISPGQRLAYIADAAGTPENMKKIIALADGADHLFVEAAFSHIDREIARKKHHLTARQAGELALSCRVKQYSLFHYSPRYSDCPDMLEAEAEKAFSGQPSSLRY